MFSDITIVGEEISVVDPYSSDPAISIPSRKGLNYLQVEETGSETAVLFHHEDRDIRDFTRISRFERVGTILANSSIIALTDRSAEYVKDALGALYKDADSTQTEELDAQQIYEFDHGIAVHLLKDGPVGVFQYGSTILLATSGLRLEQAAELLGIGKKPVRRGKPVSGVRADRRFR